MWNTAKSSLNYFSDTAQDNCHYSPDTLHENCDDISATSKFQLEGSHQVQEPVHATPGDSPFVRAGKESLERKQPAGAQRKLFSSVKSCSKPLLANDTADGMLNVASSKTVIFPLLDIPGGNNV